MYITWKINNTPNFANNGSREIYFDSIHGGECVEHIGLGFVEISWISSMQDDAVTETFDLVYLR